MKLNFIVSTKTFIFSYLTHWLMTNWLIWLRPVASIKWLGGLSEGPTLTPPSPRFRPSLKHTPWYMSGHYICLQYLLFLSLIFRLCWLWRNRELVWDIVRGKFAKQLLSVFFLPNEVISYVYKGQSICSVLLNMQHHELSWGGSVWSLPLLSTNTSSPALKLKTIFH